MSNITFDAEGKTETLKEDIEWLRLWCEETNDQNLPRVALIGDSITEGYFRYVLNALKGIARVDVLTTSYSIKSNAYNMMVKSFVADSDYAVVHYNYGLHAHSVDDDTYEEECAAMLDYIAKRAKVVVGTSTIVLENDLQTESANWQGKVRTRNERLLKIAKAKGFVIDDLNSISRTLLGDYRAPDGVHFSEKGYEVLAGYVVESIKKVLG
ncbi:MAG: SGNH/GDSL hydrolase family protein [Clostridiales bacterium]|nr:SGNH/GDSL hydrolase family protein [Clostridiales bacterium]